jgi:hypothetical protein
MTKSLFSRFENFILADSLKIPCNNYMHLLTYLVVTYFPTYLPTSSFTRNLTYTGGGGVTYGGKHIRFHIGVKDRSGK